MSMFDTAVRAEIALGRGDVKAGLGLWRSAAAALRHDKHGRPGIDLSLLEPWARQVQAIAVVAHARHGQLSLVAEITEALPGALSALTADLGAPGPPGGPDSALPDCGSLLMALALTDIGLGHRAADVGRVRSGARMVALAMRFGIKSGFWPTASPVLARGAAQDADGPAYDDAVSSYAGLDAAGLRTAARAALAARTHVSG
jgi:hypothetical protein